MLPAYQAYLKAVRYRDAFAYGGHDAPSEAELNTASEDLASKSASMEPWVDEVTGQYKSKQPTFTNNKGQLSVNNTTEYTYYNNIIYTEDCVGKNSDKSGGDSSGMFRFTIQTLFSFMTAHQMQSCRLCLWQKEI